MHQRSGVCWVDAPGLNVLHVVNAWEEDGGDTVVMVASNIMRVEHMLGRMDLVRMSLEMIRIDVKGKRVVARCPVSRESLDFAVINPQYAGKKSRYVYAAVVVPTLKGAGVVKLDLSFSSKKMDHLVARRVYGPDCYGGEPFFVPREPNNLEADEDDGYLVMQGALWFSWDFCEGK
ncbi:carotenoid cleavage dioxygenase 4 [Striga asiatica]|uniref:Carotenoid cleavage dioxygenase 4 n=1 Tax=Striga asiatica TaxID=4170 RepID=A0A5A7RG83_STRAF|nr:carotenoid cleavage dioxygenase 4 [Striga asiatica]